MNIKEVINRISYFRSKEKLSARELSLMIGKNEAYINRLESMEFNLPTSILLDIIETLKITPSEFFADNYKNYKAKQDLDKLIIDVSKTIAQDKLDNLIKFIKENF